MTGSLENTEAVVTFSLTVCQETGELLRRYIASLPGKGLEGVSLLQM